MSLSVAQMRQRLSDLYPTPTWKRKIRVMSDNQVIAIHIRLTLKGVLK